MIIVATAEPTGQTRAMERLSAADASFLYMENPTVHMHVTGVLVLDTSSMPGGARFDVIRDHIVARLHLIPAFRRRLLEIPLGVDHPVWVEDPHFDIDDHVHHETLRAPGTMAELATYVGNYASEPMDRSRPLWDMVVLDGLADGSLVIVSKVHHIAVDDTSGNDLMARLVDLTPDAVQVAGPEPPMANPRIPSRATLVVGAAASRAAHPMRFVSALGRTVASVARLGRAAIDVRSGGPSMARPFDSPRVLFNQSLTRRRAVAFGTASLDDLRFVKDTFETTVNDVFLAASAAALRGYILDRGGLCDRPLTCSVPVSVHGLSSGNSSPNQVSNMFVRLPVDTDDPVEQLLRVRHDTRDAKTVHGAIGADMIGDVTELTPPAIFNLASRMYSRIGLAERLPPIHNLVISNVPGPPVPLFVAGARLTGIYPFGPLSEGAGVNIGVISNMGHLDIGVIGCPDIAPDLEDLLEGITDGIDRLTDAARVEVARRKSAKRASRKGGSGVPKRN